MVQPRSAASSAQLRSARAEMVSSGLVPSDRGMMEPSETYRPSCTASPVGPANTRPLWSTTPCSAASPITQPPSGCTVTRWCLKAGVHSGLGTAVPPRAVAASLSRSLTAWKIGSRAHVGPVDAQAVASTRRMRPAVFSWVITR